ncbi:MAG: DUF5791 family protein [Natrialbaceae archaeon]
MLAAVDASGHDAATLYRAFQERLGETIERIGEDAVVEGTDLDGETVTALTSGPDWPVLTLAEVAAVLALEGGREADAIAAEARDRLLLDLSNAVLDVEALSEGLGRTASPKELQAKMEGRHPMTLADYAELRAFVAGET